MKKDKGLKAMSAIEAPAMDDDYKIDNDMRTMMSAEEIKMDPDRMAKVHKRAGRHHKAIKSIQDLKDTYNEKFGAQAGKKKDFE